MRTQQRDKRTFDSFLEETRFICPTEISKEKKSQDKHKILFFPFINQENKRFDEEQLLETQRTMSLRRRLLSIS